MRKLSINFRKSWLLIVLLVVALSFLMVGSFTIARADTNVPVMNFEQGASVRLNSDGLRFRVEIDEDTKNYIVDNDNVTMGFFIAPTELMSAVQDGKYENMAKKIEVSVDENNIYANDNGNYFVNGCVYNFLPENRTRDYTAVAFVKVDGEYIYSSLSLSRGIYSTLNLLMVKEGISKAIINSMMETYTWFGTESYPIEIRDEIDYANICTLVNAGITFENSYLKVNKELFVANMPSGFNGTFTNDSAKIYNYGYIANEVGEQQLGTITLPTANKVDNANQVIEDNILATSVTLNGNTVEITNNTINATEIGVYKVVFAGDETTKETTFDLYVRNAYAVNEIEAFNDEYFTNNFYLRQDSKGGSTQKGATVSYMSEYQGATGVAKIDFAYNTAVAPGTCGFHIVPRFATQAALAEYDYITVRAFVPRYNDNLIRMGLGYSDYIDNNHMPASSQWLNWDNTECKGQWFEYTMDLTVVCWAGEGEYRNYLLEDRIMSLELVVAENANCAFTLYVDSITAGKNSFGNEIIAQDANQDGSYALNEEVTLSIAGIDNAEFTVTAPNGDNVVVVNNKFTPTKGGQYTITSNVLGIANKVIDVAIVRVPYGENEIEAFSDEYFTNNFYLRQDASDFSTQKGATVTYMDEYQGATGVIKIDIDYDESVGAGSCGFHIVPRFATQADLAEYDYIIVRAYMPLYTAFNRFGLGYYWATDKDNMPTIKEWIDWNNTDCKGMWYDFKIDMTTVIWSKVYRDLLKGDKVMTLEFPVSSDVTFYIDSITAGKNA